MRAQLSEGWKHKDLRIWCRIFGKVGWWRLNFEWIDNFECVCAEQGRDEQEWHGAMTKYNRNDGNKAVSKRQLAFATVVPLSRRRLDCRDSKDENAVWNVYVYRHWVGKTGNLAKTKGLSLWDNGFVLAILPCRANASQKNWNKMMREILYCMQYKERRAWVSLMESKRFLNIQLLVCSQEADVIKCQRRAWYVHFDNAAAQ